MPITIKKIRKKYEPALKIIVESGFETNLLEAAFDNLESPGPLSFNNFAYALRELLRHVFHRLAPDDAVENCSWYKPDPTSKTGITRSHRATYMIQGGLTDFYVKKFLGIDVSVVTVGLLKGLDTLNGFTHVGPTTFGISRSKVATLALQCLKAAKYFIDHIATCRVQVIEALGEAVDQHLLNEAIGDTINELDELATHYFIDEVYVDSASVIDLGPTELVIDVMGIVGVELQYGSNSDVESGIGSVTSDSFPFTAKVYVAFERPLGKSARVRDLEVDTSAWYE